jgi:F0F1-type ATP synthase assembly protein I
MNDTVYKVLVYFAISFCFAACSSWVSEDRVFLALIFGLLGAYNVNQLILFEINKRKRIKR